MVASSLDDGDLAHHAVVLMLEDVAVIHEWHPGRRRVVEAHEDLGVLVDQDRVLPS